MSNKRLGYIPEQMMILSAGAGPVAEHWYSTSQKGIEEVIPAHAVHINKKNTLSIRIRGKAPIKEEKCQNSPMSLRIVGVEYNRHSTVYKVIDQRNYLFDLREDIMLDTIFNVGIKAGGFMEGEYVWGILGNQTKIIRVGSDLYNNLIEGTKLKNLKRISLKELKPNTLYESKSGDVGFFVGFVTTHGHIGYAESKRINKAMLWLNIHRHPNTKESDIELVRLYLDGGLIEVGRVRAQIKSNHNFVKETETLVGIPPGPGMIYTIRDKCRNLFMDSTREQRRINENFRPNRWDIAIYDTLCNMVPYGKEPDIMPEFV